MRFGFFPGLLVVLLAAWPQTGLAGPAEAEEALKQARALQQAGQYFKAARYAFSALDDGEARKPEIYALITQSLASAGLDHSAAYFFIRTLQTKDKEAIRKVLPRTQEFLVQSGPDLFRKYLVEYTSNDDYDAVNRSAYLMSLGKTALLRGDERKAIEYLSGVSTASPLWPFALQMRASARAINGQNQAALADFRECVNRAEQIGDTAQTRKGVTSAWRRQRRQLAEDLEARCQAGVARTLYQMEDFSQADYEYDQIAKKTFVWTDILFEQAWNSFARKEYNRTLGKLVSYKSPGLSFVFNTEVDVLRAQTYLALCLYADTNKVIDEFNAKYAKLGEDLKRFIEANSTNLYVFHREGRQALQTPWTTQNQFYRLINRFIRGPYFQSLVVAENSLNGELNAITQFDQLQPGVSHEKNQGFPGFLRQVLGWKRNVLRQLGGAFVKNSLLDYYSILLSDFEKMSFIKVEMLSRTKEKLIYGKSASEERSRGNVEPSRRDDQYFWTFNGEFWNDEIGDYVFGLESECQSGAS
ncbi:MAG: tetratricopeptide repeat protein [Bacteriovoracia bacterium]